MAERSVSVVLRAEVAQFKAAIAQASASVRQFSTDAQGYVSRNSAQIDTLTGALGKTGLALTGLATLAIAKFANFDEAMSKVAATGQEARASLDELRDAAIEAGQRTAFSATEAAGGIEALAKAGVSAADILNGGLNGALDLAAAGNLDVASSAEVAAIAMAQFGLSGEQVSHVADLLAAGAGKATGEVSDFAAALRQSGQVAAQTGLSIEETAAALAAFAEAGLLGSDAGTSLKTMLQRLTAPAGEAARLMDDLGISAYDASGEFVGLETLAGQLRAGLENLTPAQRNAALATIFGADAVRAATVLYEQGAEGIAEWTDAVNDQGYAAQVAATQMDNLKGDLEQLGGSVETALIQMGEGGDGALRMLTQGATGAVNAFSDLPPAVQSTTLAFVGAGGLVMLGVAGLGRLAVAANEVRGAVQALGVSMRTAGLAAGGIIGIVGLAAVAFFAFAASQQQARQDAQELASTLDDLSGALTEASRKWMFDQAVEKGWVDAANQVGLSVDVLIDAMMGVPSAVDQVNSALAAARGENATAGFSWEQLGQAVEFGAEKIADAEGAATDEAAAMDGATSATERNARAHEAAAASVEELIAALESLNQLNRDTLGAAIEWEESLRDLSAALEENGQTLDITTEKGAANARAMLDAAEAAEQRAQTILEQTGSEEQFIASLEDSRLALFNSAVSFGLSEEAAWAYVDSILSVPPTTETLANLDVTQAIADLASLGVTIDETTGTVTINGNPAPAEMTLGELIGNVDQASGTVTINGNRYPADITVGQLTAWINSQTGTVTAQANTAAAETALNYLARVRYSTIFASVITSSVPASIAAPGGAQGGLIGHGKVIRGFAGGGLVPGVPPPDPARDNVLARGPGGLFALRSQEFVATQASAARNYAALVAGNRGATLAVVSAGYAGGGSVGNRGSSGRGALTRHQSPDGLAAAVRSAVNGALILVEDRGPLADQVSGRILVALDQEGA